MAKTGHFDGVIKAIDDVEETLKDEGQEDIEKRDHCKEEYLEIESTVHELNWKIENNEKTIDKQTAHIAAKTAEKAATIEAIADVTKEIEQMESERIAENEEFLNAKSDDEAAIDLLTQAKAALSSFTRSTRPSSKRLFSKSLRNRYR